MLNVSLVPNGLHHAVTSGDITVNAVPGYGEVSALGASQLLKLLLPFDREITNKAGYQDQVYVVARLSDASVTNVALDAVQFEQDPVTRQSVLRLRVDIAANPGNLLCWIESHHSTGR